MQGDPICLLLQNGKPPPPWSSAPRPEVGLYRMSRGGHGAVRKPQRRWAAPVDGGQIIAFSQLPDNNYTGTRSHSRTQHARTHLPARRPGGSPRHQGTFCPSCDQFSIPTDIETFLSTNVASLATRSRTVKMVIPSSGHDGQYRRNVTWVGDEFAPKTVATTNPLYAYTNYKPSLRNYGRFQTAGGARCQGGEKSRWPSSGPDHNIQLVLIHAVTESVRLR